MYNLLTLFSTRGPFRRTIAGSKRCAGYERRKKMSNQFEPRLAIQTERGLFFRIRFHSPVNILKIFAFIYTLFIYALLKGKCQFFGGLK